MPAEFPFPGSPEINEPARKGPEARSVTGDIENAKARARRIARLGDQLEKPPVSVAVSRTDVQGAMGEGWRISPPNPGIRVHRLP